jgi:hypothetical protein
VTGTDDDFEDFLKRRKPSFRSPDDMFEPPADLDRVVLRQAREAIEAERPLRVFRNPRWATPVALAATLVLAFTVLFYAGLPQKRAPVPEVTVQNVAERIDMTQAEPPIEAAPAAAANNEPAGNEGPGDALVVDLTQPEMARRESATKAAPSPSAAPTAGRARMGAVAEAPQVAAASADSSSEVPVWRRDAKTWLAEIERLRSAGDNTRADAELAEYKRQQRAYAGAPDR